MPHQLSGVRTDPVGEIASELMSRRKARALARITAALASEQVQINIADFQTFAIPESNVDRAGVESLRRLVLKRVDADWLRFALPGIQRHSLESAVFVERLMLYSEPLSAPALACIAFARSASENDAVRELIRISRGTASL